MRRNNTKRLALCGILAALALALMFLGVLPFAAIACPVLASLVLIPVYIECGKQWGWLWFLAVAILAVLIAPEKESAILFVFFGYYPMIKKYLGRLPKMLKYFAKFLYINLLIFVAYWLMLKVFGLTSVSEDFKDIQRWTLAVMLVLANASFFVYDILIDRIEVVYHVRLRRKFKL